VRRAGPWWKVRFNQVEGPVPIFRKFPSLDEQINALGKQVVGWIRDEGVRPGDICILYNGKNVRARLEQQVAPMLQAIGSDLTVVGRRGWRHSTTTVLVSTTHSYKGYDSEVVVIAGAEQFIAREKGILASNLYVAMTRARSVLAVYATSHKGDDENTRKLLATLQKCLDGLLERPAVEQEPSDLDDCADLLGRLGDDRRDWLAALRKSYQLVQEPITAEDGEILAEPLFWFRVNGRVVACFGDEEPGAHALHLLEDNRIEVLRPGEDLRVSAPD
jgi:hypothetical protein